MDLRIFFFCFWREEKGENSFPRKNNSQTSNGNRPARARNLALSKRYCPAPRSRNTREEDIFIRIKILKERLRDCIYKKELKFRILVFDD